MKALAVICFVLFAASLRAQELAPAKPAVRFQAVDIFVDSRGKPLAAYQLEFSITNGVAKIVGIEGGEHTAFSKPPFYDPRAMQQERVIIAGFSTEPAKKLPIGKTRVATIHLELTGTAEPKFELKLQAAADTSGKRISVESSFEERKSK